MGGSHDAGNPPSGGGAGGAGEARAALRVVHGGAAPARVKAAALEARRRELADLQDRAAAYRDQDRAPSTIRAYRADWAHFEAWCALYGREPLPAVAETVELYLTAHAETHKPATLARRLVSIARAHKKAGEEPPTRAESVRAVFGAICREMGTAQSAKAPLTVEDVRTILAALPDNLKAKRDRAILLLGLAGGFRRSELVGLNVADLELTEAGYVVTIRRSKTDQKGKGRTVGIPRGAHEETCPVRAVEGWLKAAKIRTGPIFRLVDRHGNVAAKRLAGEGAAIVIKTAAERVGLNPDRYAGHSLRRGLVTAAAKKGVSEHDIMKTTGHRSEKMVRRYIEQVNVFERNAAAAIDL